MRVSSWRYTPLPYSNLAKGLSSKWCQWCWWEGTIGFTIHNQPAIIIEYICARPNSISLSADRNHSLCLSLKIITNKQQLSGITNEKINIFLSINKISKHTTTWQYQRMWQSDEVIPTQRLAVLVDSCGVTLVHLTSSCGTAWWWLQPISRSAVIKSPGQVDKLNLTTSKTQRSAKNGKNMVPIETVRLPFLLMMFKILHQ